MNATQPIVDVVASSAVVNRIGWLLAHSVWQFTLIAAIAITLRWLMRRGSAAARYGMLSITLMLMGLAPLGTWALLPAGAKPAGTTETQVRAGDSKPTIESHEFPMTRLVPLDLEDAATESDNSGSTAVGQIPQPIAVHEPIHSTSVVPLVVPSDSWTTKVADWIAPWLPTIVTLWCLGVILCSSRPLLGWYTVRRLRTAGVSEPQRSVRSLLARLQQRLGIVRAVRVLQSELVPAPVVVGCFRSVILLPTSLITNLSVPHLEAILAHELAHVRRYDYLVNLWQTCVETLFFYHPAIWWISRQIRIEREHCCDDLAVSVLGDRVQYGRALLAIEEHRSAELLLALGARDGSLLARVQRLLIPDRLETPNAAVGGAGLSLMAAGLIGALIWSTMAAEAMVHDPSNGNDPVAVNASQEPEATTPTTSSAPASEDATASSGENSVTFRVQAVDENDVPVAGAIFRGRPFNGKEISGTADTEGRFAIDVPTDCTYVTLRVLDPDRRLIWADVAYAKRFRNGDSLPGVDELLTARLVPLVESTVQVLDVSGSPVRDATVVVQNALTEVDVLHTDTAGNVTVRLPEKALPMIMAFKPDVGYDYFSADVRDENNYPTMEPPKLPENLKLVLNGAKTLRVRAVDSSGQPVAGATIRPWYVKKEGIPGETNFVSNAFHQTTGDDGLATFDWLPPNVHWGLTFWTHANGHDADRLEIPKEFDENRIYEVVLKTTTPLSGRVVDANGQPVNGVEVRLEGHGVSHDQSHEFATTDAEGRFDLMVAPDKAYVAHVQQGELVGYAAPLVVREGQPVTDVEIQLAKGTVIHGQVSRGTPSQPVADEWMLLSLEMGQVPDEIEALRKPDDSRSYKVSFSNSLYTDKDGRFRFVAAPGEYVLFGPRQAKHHKFVVTNEAEREFHFDIPRPEFVQFSGAVRGPNGQTIADTRIYGVYEGTTHSRHAFTGSSDANGRFDIKRETQPATVQVLSADKSLGTIFEVDGDLETANVELRPTYRASGRLLNDDGTPWADATIKYGVKVYQGPKGKSPWVNSFGGHVTTDAGGRYTLEYLIQDAEYDITLERLENGPSWSRLTTVNASGVKAVNLGEKRLP